MDRTRSPLDRLSDDVVLCLFSRAPFTTHGKLQAVCRRLRTLVRSREFLQQRVDSGLAEYGLVVAGGARGGEPLAECSMLSSERQRLITPLLGPRECACSAVVEDEDGQPEMWVMGGWSRGGVVATVEAYNPRTNTWRSCPPLSQRRAAAAAGVVGGRLVVAGGFAPGLGSLTSVEAYTPTGWTPLPPLPHAAYIATACVLNGRLHVMGGTSSKKLQVLEMSEENEFSWTVKADLPAPQYDAASTVHEGKLWLMGGIVNGASSSAVSIYDNEADSWMAGPDLPDTTNGGARATTTLNGDLRVTCYHATWVYRNARWEEVQDEDDTFPATRYSVCESILLG